MPAVAFPAFTPPSWPATAPADDYVLTAQTAWRRRDVATVRDVLSHQLEARAGLCAAAVTFEGLLAESQLWFELGDTRQAIALLDPSLSSLPERESYQMSSPVEAATMVRVMALRALLADQAADRPGAAKWAQVVLALWPRAESHHDHTIRRMHDLADHFTP